ncbi:MAG: hypothetical protein R3E79_56275 [Caldilineaceae bacterium]
MALHDSLLTISADDASSEIAGVTVKITPPGGSPVTINADPGDDDENATWFTLFQPTVAGQYTIDVTATDGVARRQPEPHLLRGRQHPHRCVEHRHDESAKGERSRSSE